MFEFVNADIPPHRRQLESYPISSPLSLQLRLAKNQDLYKPTTQLIKCGLKGAQGLTCTHNTIRLLIIFKKKKDGVERALVLNMYNLHNPIRLL